MKKLLIILCFWGIFSQYSFSQCNSSWEYLNVPKQGFYLKSADTNSKGVYFAVGGNGTILTSSNYFKSFIKIKTKKNYNKINFNAIKFIDEKTGFIVGDCGVVLKSTTYGNSWEEYINLDNTNLTTLDYKYNILTCAGNNGLIYYSYDQGKTFKKGNLPNAIVGKINKISIIDSNIIIAVGENTALYLSKDKGQNWKTQYNPSTKFNFTDVVANENMTVLAGGPNVLYVSYDKGDKFERFNINNYPSGYLGGSVQFNCVNIFSDTIIAFGNFKGYFISYDRGNTWIVKEHSDNSINYSTINSILKTKTNNYLLFGQFVSQNSSLVIETDKSLDSITINLLGDGTIPANDILNLHPNNYTKIVKQNNPDTSPYIPVMSLVVSDSGLVIPLLVSGEAPIKTFNEVWHKGKLNETSQISLINYDTYSFSSDSGVISICSIMNKTSKDYLPYGKKDEYYFTNFIEYASNNLYVGMNFYPILFSHPRYTLFRSPDFGKNWYEVKFPTEDTLHCFFNKTGILNNQLIVTLIKATNEDHPTFGSKYKEDIFKINNNNVTKLNWNFNLPDSVSYSFNDLNIIDSNNIYVLIKISYPSSPNEKNFCLYYTKNGGDKWELISNNIFPSPQFKTTEIQIKYFDTSNAVMLLGNMYFFLSKDGGKTWEIDNDYLGLHFHNVNDFITLSYENLDYIVSVGNFEAIARGIKNNKTSSIPNILQSSYDRDLFFPNPATDYLNIHNYREITGNIEIFSTLGNKLIEAAPSEKIFIGDLPVGSYLIKIDGKIEKFVKI